MSENTQTAVLEVGGMIRASSKNVPEAHLSRQPGVISVEANPVSQTANVTYDPAVTSVPRLRQEVLDCGYHCAGRSVPDHICDPLHDPTGHDQQVTDREYTEHAEHATHDGGHEGRTAPTTPTPQDVMGHGGHRADASMESMIRDMRNRFIVAAVLSVAIVLWSPIGRDVFGFTVPAPFGLRDED